MTDGPPPQSSSRGSLEPDALSSEAATPGGPELEALLHGVRRLLQIKCRRFGLDPTLADDLCNDAFRVLFERLRVEPLRDPSKVAAFLAQTAQNLFIAERRKSNRRHTGTGADEAIGNEPAPATDVAESLQNRDLARIVRAVLERMKVPRDREILVRYYLRDEDKSRICRDLGLTEMHFNRVIDRARERFKALLAPDHGPTNLFGVLLLPALVGAVASLTNL